MKIRIFNQEAFLGTNIVNPILHNRLLARFEFDSPTTGYLTYYDFNNFRVTGRGIIPFKYL